MAQLGLSEPRRRLLLTEAYDQFTITVFSPIRFKWTDVHSLSAIPDDHAAYSLGRINDVQKTIRQYGEECEKSQPDGT